MSRGQFKSDYLLKKCGIGVSGNISVFQAEVDSSSLLFHSEKKTISKDRVMNSKYIKTQKRKAEQLGMPLGTASNRLRKLILFKILKDNGLNICYRCGKPIESADVLSIEHKENWLDSDNPKEKFFDLENIGFSHLSCNISCARHDTNRNTVIDKVKRGLHPNCHLTMEQANKIRELGSTMKGTDIAKKFGVSKHTVYRILKGKTFNYQ